MKMSKVFIFVSAFLLGSLMGRTKPKPVLRRLYVPSLN